MHQSTSRRAAAGLPACSSHPQPGRDLPRRRNLLQDQKEHQAEQAAGCVCEQGRQGRQQHPVRRPSSLCARHSPAQVSLRREQDQRRRHPCQSRDGGQRSVSLSVFFRALTGSQTPSMSWLNVGRARCRLPMLTFSTRGRRVVVMSCIVLAVAYVL